METTENLLKKPVFVVEANSFERSTLHSKYENSVRWFDVPMGKGQKVGLVADNKEIWISLNWAYIEDVPVLFWSPTSKVVDYDICQHWLRNNINIIPSGDRGKMLYDTDNFHNCINDIKDHIERSRVKSPFINYCDEQAIKALRYLAENDRPSYGNQKFNSESLYMIADELEKSIKKIKDEYNSSTYKG